MKRVNIKLLLGLIASVAIVAGGLFVLHRFQVARNAGGLAKLARQRLEEGKVDEALGLFARYLGMRPDDAEVQREYAGVVLDQIEGGKNSRTDLQRGYNILEEAVRRNPDDDPLRFKLAEFQVRVGRFTDAREHLETLRSRFGRRAAGGEGEPDIDNDDLQLLMVRCLAGEGNFDAAARLAGDLIGYDVQRRSFDPDRRGADSAEPYVLLASILQERLDDPTAADAILEDLGKRRSDDAMAWLALSRWHRQQNDLEAARQDMSKAVAIAPDDMNVIWGSFELALARGEFDTARHSALRASELAPDDERVYRGLAALALQQNDLAAAETALRDGVARVPGKASLMLMLADTLLQQGKLDATDAIVAELEGISRAANPAIGLLQGRVLIARRRWPQARRKLEETRPLAVGFDELTKQIDLCLGQCYEHLEEFDVQLDVSRRILVDDPTSVVARVARASALAAGGKSAEALEEFEAVAAVIPADRLPTVPQVWYPLMQLRVQEQLKRPVSDRDWSRVDALLKTLEESASISTSQIALLRADVLARKGEDEAAAGLLERATQAADADPQVWSAYALLLLRVKGPDAAREVIGRLPADRANHPAILAVRMQLAAQGSAEESSREFAAIEARAQDLSPEEASRLLSSLAGLRLEAGDIDEAERLWREAARRQPDDLRSRTALLDVAMKRGDVEKAKAAAADIESIAGRSSARARVAQAGVRILEVRQAQERRELLSGKIELTAAENRLLEEAQNLLIEAENDRPGWHLIQIYAAEIDGLKGDIPAAIDRLQRALRLGPASPDVVRQLVSLLYSSNRLDEARKALDSLGPDGLAGFERLSAEMEMRLGRLDEAVAIAERAVSLDSKNGVELLWLAQLLDRSGRRDRAGELFAKAVDVSPDRTEAWLALFSHQLSTGRRRAAENTLDRAAAALPSPARELVLAQGAEMLGRLDVADRAYRDAAAAAPKDVGIATSRAEFLVRVGRVDAARESLRQVIASPADDAATRNMKAWGRRKLAELMSERGTYQELREAIVLLDANIGQDGTLAAEDAATKVAILANRPEPENWRLAIEVLEAVRERQPLTTAQRLTLAGLLEKVGRWEESRQELMSIVSAPQTPPAFIAMLAEKLIAHGDISGARSWVKRLQDAAPETPATIAIEARLAIADKDRPRATELARRLMPAGEVTSEQSGQLAAIAQLLEELDFPKAADALLAKYAALSPDGSVARARFLGRQGRTDEALEVLEGAWDALPLERILSTAIDALRLNPKAEAAAARIERWLAKARRIDPGSVVVALVEAELLSLRERDAEVEARYREILTRKDLEPPQRAIVSNNLAFHLAEPKTAAEAKQFVDAAIATIGPHPDLLDTRGLVLLALGQDREAVTDLEQAVLQPSDVKFLHLAYALLRTGNLAAARTALESGRKNGLTVARLSGRDRARLRELEATLGVAPEQAAADGAGAGRG